MSERRLPMIYLVRHGETAWTLTAQHTGRTDLPLNEHGERQARELEPSLAALRIDRIFSSPLQRARRTAELAMPHSLVEADDDLMEWDYGAYEGRSTVDIEVERPGWRLLRDGSPGGGNARLGNVREKDDAQAVGQLIFFQTFDFGHAFDTRNRHSLRLGSRLLRTHGELAG